MIANMLQKLDQVKASVLLFSDCDAYAQYFTQSVLSYCPLTNIVHADSLDQVTTWLDAMQIDILFVDARMGKIQERIPSIDNSKIKSMIALVDPSVSPFVQHDLVALNIDGFVLAEHFLNIALRLKEFCRLNLTRELVGEYDTMLQGQVSELFLLHKVVDNAAIMMATLDADLTLMTANGSFCDLCHERHLSGKPLSDYLCGELYNHQILPALVRALSGESVCVQSLAGISPQVPFVQLYCHPLYDFDERVQGVALVLNDISELKLMEQRYQEISREFTTLLNGISDAITLIRSDGTVAWGNQAAETVWNLKVGEHLERSCCLSKAGGDCASATSQTHDGPHCLVRRCLERGEKQTELLNANDGRSLGVKVFPLMDEHQQVTGAIRIVSDVTESVQLKNEATQNSRLAALGELAAGVAHEINNPNGLLAMNNGLLEEICRDLMQELVDCGGSDGNFGGFTFSELEEDLPQLFRNNRLATTNIRRIVEDLKQFTRSEMDRFESVDVNEVVLAASRMVANSLKKSSHDVRIVYAEDLPPLAGSFQGLEQVVINLLMNACQALTAPDQAIEVVTCHDSQAQQVCIQVTDGGRGISTEHLDKIFDPFFTTKREEGGTGLGLSVSSRIIKEHGGTLRYDSQPGEGTCVTVSLPVGDTE